MTYTAQDIEVLEGLEPVRKRPGMYIGGTEGPQGLHHLVKEILDNSIDEVMNGYANNIEVILHSDSESITITDNGRGIPVDDHPKFKKSALEIILTTLHAGGKFSAKSYSSAGGLHGVGSSVVNALSSELKATVSRDGYVWQQSFSQGKPTSKIKKGEKTKLCGTQIFFRPDKEIFRITKFSSEIIEKILQEKAFLNKGLTIKFIDEVKNEKKSFCYKEGLREYLTLQLQKSGEEPLAGEIFALDRGEGIKVDVAFAWTENTEEKISSYVNGIFTSNGGSHEEGFKNGLSRAIRNYITTHNLLPKGIKLTGEDMREGLYAIVSVNVPGTIAQLQFQGQTKDKLNNPEVTPPVEALMKSFENALNTKQSIAAAVVERIILSAKARAAARSASQNVSRKIGVSHRLNLPGKLADCSSTQPDKSELFIVEGDSAGGSTKQGRDRKTQAVLPLKGKILNSIAATDEKLRDNKEVLDLVSVLGCGFGANIKLDKLRYSKVVILTDADSDGMHIAALLMAFFYRYMKPLILNKHLYLALSPLYRVRTGGGGKEVDHWAFTEEEKDKILKGLGRAKFQVTRFKGLGEMNPKTLWETTLNPKTRSLLQINVNNDASAAELFENLLGRDSSHRYRLIQENAHLLEVDV